MQLEKTLLIGRGLLARAFSEYFERDSSVVVFASGVSGSQCESEAEYLREEKLLRDALTQNEAAGLFVYFGTCSVFDPSARQTRYVKHKLQMEDLVSTHTSHLVLRLPIVVGQKGNPHSLVRHLVDRVRSEQVIEVWQNAGRYLVDVEDVAAIGRSLIVTDRARNERINVAGPHDTTMPELVGLVGRVLGRAPVCRYIDRGSRYTIDTRRIEASVERAGVTFGGEYVENLLRKYYGSETAD